MARKHLGNRELLYPDDYINDALKQDLYDLEIFANQQGFTKATIKNLFSVIYRLLGWLHRYQSVDLEHLRITSIIQYYPLTVSRNYDKDIEKVRYKRSILKEEANEFAADNIDLLKKYLSFLDITNGHVNSKKIVITYVVMIAKFVFDKEIGRDDEFMEYKELPVIKRLHRLSRALPKNKEPKVQYSEKIVDWEEALQILDKLRQKCTATHYARGRKIPNSSKAIHLC
jgi:hypothetical protein